MTIDPRGPWPSLGSAPVATDPTKAHAPLRALLVEDNPADVHLLQEELRLAVGASPLALVPVATLAQAIDVLGGEQDEIDLVLADLGLPDSEGRETIARLLATRPDLPVVALTGHDDDVAALAAVDAGAQDYIVKGTVPGPALARMLRHAVERHRLLSAQQRSLRFRDELLEFTQLALRDVTVDVLHDELARLLVDTLPATRAGVFLADPALQQAVPVAWRAPGATGSAAPAVPGPIRAVVRAVLETAEPQIRRGEATSPSGPTGGFERGSIVAAPVVRDDTVALVLLADSSTPDAFDTDDLTFVIGLAFTLTQALRRREAEASLNARMSELNLTVAQLPGLLWTMDEDLCLVSCSGTALEWMGVATDAEVGKRLDELPSDFSALGLDDSARRALRGEALTTVGSWRGRWLRTWCEPLRDARGAVIGVTGLSLDVTEEYRKEAELEHRALHDPVTQLANRVLFGDRLQHALTRVSRSGAQVAVAVVDLDEFKQINDSLGHAAGDAVLIDVARRLEATVRDSDTAARLGGDEFGLLLEGVSCVEDGREVLERVLEALRRPFLVEGRELVVTASIGLTLSGGDDEAATLLRDADTAVYIAKATGRNRHVVFEPDMHLAATRQLEVRTELALAIEQQRIELHFQPIVDLATGVVSGAEALARWHHPGLGNVPPNEFIPVAEQCGLMVPLGWWVLERACAELARWQQRSPGFLLSVNVSSRQLHQEDFVTELGRLLRRHHVRPEGLCLELTEGSLLEVDVIVPLLERLRRLGVRVAVDDFGTGYSSFAYLRRFALDIIKIDREFIADIAEGPEEAAIAQALLQLASTLDISVTAEGVETQQQADLLRAWGCQHAQGWLWSPAVAAETFTAWTEELAEGVAVPPRPAVP